MDRVCFSRSRRISTSRPCDEHGPGGLTLSALDLHIPIPADANQSCQAAGIFSALLFIRTESAAFACRAPMQTTGNPALFKLVPEPAGHGTSLKSDALGVRRSFTQQLRKAPGSDFAFPWNTVFPVSSTTQTVVSFRDPRRCRRSRSRSTRYPDRGFKLPPSTARRSRPRARSDQKHGRQE